MSASAIIEDYFVCIGAQKAGTTWLARVLSHHPDIFVTPVKEIHYFDHVRGITRHLSRAKRRSRYRKYHQRMWTQWSRFPEHWGQRGWWRAYMRPHLDDDWYRDLFRHRGGRRMAGELTPEYAILGREGLGHIRRLAPDARVLFLLRNPIARGWSQVLHHCRREGRNVARLDSADLVAMTEAPAFRRFGDYAATLADLAATFAPDRVLVLFYEDIHADRLRALAELCAFLRVDFDPASFPDLERKYNPSQKARMPEALRAHLVETGRPIAARVAELVGRIPDDWRESFDL